MAFGPSTLIRNPPLHSAPDFITDIEKYWFSQGGMKGQRSWSVPRAKVFALVGTLESDGEFRKNRSDQAGSSSQLNKNPGRKIRYQCILKLPKWF